MTPDLDPAATIETVETVDWTVISYAVYVPLSILLTVWVARTLSKNGLPFLRDVFGGDDAMATSLNHLLVVGFYLINLGYISLALEVSRTATDLRTAIEGLSGKIGLVLVVLGAMHFFNLFVLSRMRRNVQQRRRWDEREAARHDTKRDTPLMTTPTT